MGPPAGAMPRPDEGDAPTRPLERKSALNTIVIAQCHELHRYCIMMDVVELEVVEALLHWLHAH